MTCPQHGILSPMVSILSILSPILSLPSLHATMLSAETQVARAQDIRFQLSGKHVSYSELSAAVMKLGRMEAFVRVQNMEFFILEDHRHFAPFKPYKDYRMDQSSWRWRLCIKQRHLKKVMAFGFKPKCMLLLQFMK